MKSEMPDKNIDKFLEHLLRDASSTDAEVANIADSPNLRWSVMRSIETQKKHHAMPWPPTKWLARVVAFGLPTAAAAALLIAFILWPATDVIETADLPTPQRSAEVQPPAAVSQPPEILPERIAPAWDRPSQRPNRSTRPAQRSLVSNRKAQEPRSKSQETKTDFIALSYARNPDSGQIVRVKVPSSMMVTVGLVQTVEKPTDLIDAEVLVGDDGLTHAIRFIRQE